MRSSGNFFSRDFAEVHHFLKKLLNQIICVLIQALLQGAIGMAEEILHFNAEGMVWCIASVSFAVREFAFHQHPVDVHQY